MTKNGIPILSSNGCRHKRRLTAEEAFTKSVLLTLKDGILMNDYHCTICGHYHVGHDIPKSIKEGGIIC